ncbi:uncharacterized protein LOC142557646 [Dermacentor variabilis]|uniref:uncharacterized protein LOC142557646 n=1 Tax=Dermacentor variabilis TaxID=34621 RepID=UPI003F5B7CF2
MPFESLHQPAGVRRKRLLQRPTLRLGQPREAMSTAKTRRTRPATSPACDIAPPNFMRWNSGYSNWFDRAQTGSPEKSLSSFEIDDATFLECLVNDVGSPDDSLRRPFLARTPPRPEVVVSAALTSAPASQGSKKKVTFASSNAAAKSKANSMPDLLEPPLEASCAKELTQPESKPRARNSFVFAAFSKIPFSTKRSSSFMGIEPSPVDQR